MRKHHGQLCPRIEKTLEDFKKKSMEFVCYWNGEDQFEVEGSSGTKFRVHIGEKTFSYRKWELSGISCAHAISGMYYLDHNPEDYVDDAYKNETYLRVYSHLMGTIGGSDEWPEVENLPLIPPVVGNLPERPKKYNRRKGQDEAKGKKKVVEIATGLKLTKREVVMKCSICKQPNHNSRGCHKNPQSRPTNQGLDMPAATTNGKEKESQTNKQSQTEPISGKGKKNKEKGLEGTSSTVNVVVTNATSSAPNGEGKAFTPPIGQNLRSSRNNVRFSTTKPPVTSSQTSANQVPPKEPPPKRVTRSSTFSPKKSQQK
ncbi:MuDR family transposase [Striga asiatica]|uniref:MuDR family transposase n=1 Tax=Striga asiatica TaxID=4170 RepID=A0A5A7RAN1_STRAF|nr:MuDR family transposase [Striga asiatica]